MCRPGGIIQEIAIDNNFVIVIARYVNDWILDFLKFGCIVHIYA